MDRLLLSCFNTHVAHQNVEKDSLVLKNFAKAAKHALKKIS